MKLILVRHGVTFENQNKISQGHLNSQLSPKGVEQAKKVAQRLKDVKIDIAFSSDLNRALDTCKEILKYHNKTQLKITDLLREQSKGVFEGKPREKRKKFLKNVSFHEWKPEGGENLIEVWGRVIPFFEKIKKDYSNKTVLIVAHGGPIACILSYLHGKEVKDFREYQPWNTAVSIVIMEKDDIKFEELNCSKHLV